VARDRSEISIGRTPDGDNRSLKSARSSSIISTPKVFSEVKTVPPSAVLLDTGRRLAVAPPAALPDGDPPSATFDVIDLFSGCGGLSAGFRLLSRHSPSFRLAAAVDLDADANAGYHLNLGREPLRADLQELLGRPSAWRRFKDGLGRGRRRIVVGGPPCQGFSSHRKSIDEAGDLNDLVPAFADAVVRLGAEAALMENVPEMLTTRGWPYFQRAVAVLTRAGYFVRTRIYNFAGFGLPQERFRALSLALRRPFAMPEPFLERDRYRTVRDAIGTLPPLRPGEVTTDPEHVTAHHRSATVATLAAVPRDGGRRPAHVGPECLRRLAVRNGRSGYDDVYGRLWWDRPAVTITAHARNPASGRFGHPEQDRGLSVREAACLQGFPATYRFAGSFSSRFRQLGNAVPPSVAAFLAAHLLAELEITRTESPDIEQDVTEPVGTSFSRLIAGIKSGALRL
jgi:DNA (cytosine-5)-methyltransferase 1